jgi:alanyl-tRNA synthetase
VEGVEPKALREMFDQRRADLRDAFELLAGANDGCTNLIAGMSGSALGKVKAGDALDEVARRQRRRR